MDISKLKSYSDPVKVVIKFDKAVFLEDRYRNRVDDIKIAEISSVFRDFSIKSFEAVFSNRYDAEGKLRADLHSLANPYSLEEWRYVIVDRAIANDLVQRLRRTAFVQEVLIEDPLSIKAAIVPDDPNFDAGAQQWYLDDPLFPNADIGVEPAWDINRGRNDVIVAILDGGVDYNHPDLDPGNRTRVIGGIDTGEGDNDPLDDLAGDGFAGHGTSVAGVAGAITNNGTQVAGVMWNCRIMPVKMVGGGGVRIPHILNWDWSTTAFPSDVANAIDFAVTNGADIINLSYSFSNMGWPVNEVALRIPLLFQAIDNAYRNDVLITASMGNEFAQDNGTRYPAGFREQVMAVGATNRQRERAAFSNTGPHISVSAPGVDIVTTARGGGIRTVNGTSFSAPMTAGVAGLIIAQGRDRNFNLTNDDVRHIIERTAVDVVDYGEGYDHQTGHGIINALNALELISEPNIVHHQNAVGGTPTKIASLSPWILLDNRWGLATGTYYQVDQYRIRKHVTFDVHFCSPPRVWMRERESKSMDFSNPNLSRPFATITNVTNTGFDLEYVAYYVKYNASGQSINKWIPAAPTSTNVAFTAVGQPNVAATAGPIDGPDLICSTGTFNLVNRLSSTSVIWSSSNPSGLNINSSTGVATRVNNFSGMITISASANSGCESTNFIKSVRVGPQKPSGLLGVVVDPWLGRIKAGVSPVPDAGGYEWYVDGVKFTGAGSSSDYVTIPIARNNCLKRDYRIGVKAINACGLSSEYNEVHQNPCYGSSMHYNLFPNPATESLTIESLSDGTEKVEASNAKIGNPKRQFTLYNFNGEAVIVGQLVSGKNNVDVSKLPLGRYVLKINLNNLESETHHITLK